MSLEPRASDDLTGWHELTCEQSNEVRFRHQGLPTFVVAVGRTDTEDDIYFREWWFNDAPLLRDYNDLRGCRHYGAIDASAAVERVP